MFTYVLYALAVIGLCISFFKSKQKTKLALKKAVKSFENIMPQLLSTILIVGIMLSILDTETITKIIGANSGILGTLTAAVIGAITLIPAFVAFPLASSLLDSGAGMTQIAALISSFMMVGVVTIPMENKVFGKKVTIARNISAFVYSILVAFAIGAIL